MNHEMEESLRDRIRELEAEHEAAVERLKKQVERAEQEAEGAREDVERERMNSDKMMQVGWQPRACPCIQGGEPLSEGLGFRAKP
jgi:hypothetical protein